MVIIMKKYFPRASGFTLIELLVVIAIIAILASVVMVALGTSRNKGIDAAIKQLMTSARSQAELFYSNNNTYSNGTISICDNVTTNNIYPILSDANKKLGGTGFVSPVAFTANSSGTGNSTACHASSNAWAAITSLKNPVNGSSYGWCIDANGTAKESSSLGVGVTTCP